MKTFTFEPTCRTGKGNGTVVTIKDVAREAGVSVATVSRALNGAASVTAQTRRHVAGVAARLRYVPHGAARSLVTRRTNTVGALLPDLFGEFFSELIRGIDLAARARGLQLLVSSSHGDAAEAAAALRAMQGRVDGLLIMSPHVDARFLKEHLASALPTVLMNSSVADKDYASLNVDNYGGAQAMTRHLLAQGYRDFAFITGPSDNFDAAERLKGFRESIVASARAFLLQGDFSEESGYRAGRQLAAMQQRPQAVFAANDMMAIGCLFALTEAGLRVPGDIALAGFDDIPIARYINPPLTTVRVRIADLGHGALEHLVARMETMDPPPQRHTLACEVVPRASTDDASDARLPASTPHRP
ncbi:MAG: LacI family DNA-binding transcriptional regulator [Proteobacteria bacterium]|nr:LacI family DNA-binding transcriptional regulator [Pseudomonadota bacterium]